MDRRVISGSIDTVFEFDYSVKAEDMRGLYEKAKRDQWNATRDIAWATPEPDDGRVLFDTILTGARWYIKTIALQLVAETFAVSMFKMMAEAAVDPVLGEVCRRILLDESRHMGFGMLALPKIVREASEGERREMEDFTCLAVEKVLTGFFPLEAYQDLGFSPAQIQEVRAYRRDAAS